MGALYPRQTKCCLPIFKCLQAERMTRQRRPLLQLQTKRLMLPARCWERSLQHSKCIDDANGSGLPTANKYLFTGLLFFESGEGDKTTSPSFPAANGGIDASSALLEALIVKQQMYWWWEQERLTHGKQIPICRSFIPYQRRGRRGKVAIFYSWKFRDRCFQRVAWSAHCNITNAVRMRTRAVYPRQTNICLLMFTFYERRGPRGNVTLVYNTLSSNWGFQRIIGSAHCKFITLMWLCKRGHFSDGNQAPGCHRIVCYLRNWRAGKAAIFRVDLRLQRLVVSAHLALDAMRFLPIGILTFPCGREAHYGVLLADISSLPSVISVPPNRAIFV